MEIANLCKSSISEGRLAMSNTRKISMIAFIVSIIAGTSFIMIGTGQGLVKPQLINPVPATIYKVTKTTDTSGACTASDCSLRAAITAANAHAGNDTIEVPSGQYVLTGQVDEDLNAGGDLDITDSVTVKGTGSSPSIIDGNHADRVFHILKGARIELLNLDIRNGDHVYLGGGIGIGTTFTDASTVVLRDCIVQDNHAISQGGGIFFRGDNVRLDLLRTKVLRNVVGIQNGNDYAFGGGLHFWGKSILNIADAVFDGNRAPYGTSSDQNAGVAGALYVRAANDAAKDVILTNTQLINNSAVDTGGIATDSGSACSAALSLNNIVLQNNSATAGYSAASFCVTSATIASSQVIGNKGGTYGNFAINARAASTSVTLTDVRVVDNDLRGLDVSTQYNGPIVADRLVLQNNRSGGGELEAAGVKITNSTISDNAVVGGLRLTSTKDVVITGTTVANNASESGVGGLDIFSNASFTIEASSIVGNRSQNDTGGVLLEAQNCTIKNVTISGNSTGSGADKAGGLEVKVNNAQLSNVTMTGNAAPAGSGSLLLQTNVHVSIINSILSSPQSVTMCDFRGGVPLGIITSQGYNLVSDTSCNLTAAGDHQNIDPKLGPLADNGGLTMTHILLAGSPAIDAGGTVAAVTKDQRGVDRPKDGNGDGTIAYDIGAVEIDFFCGNGTKNADEECDDGSANSNTGACLPTCVSATCGDGFVWAGHEECDDGAANSDTRACLPNCVKAKCGDGFVEAGVEECDDGNTVDGDGCSALCNIEQTAQQTQQQAPELSGSPGGQPAPTPAPTGSGATSGGGAGGEAPASSSGGCSLMPGLR